MSKRKRAETSISAHASLDPDKIKAMYLKIANCLKEHGPQTYEQIASQIGEKPEKIWKRMTNALNAGLCYRNGDKRKMESGRFGFVWFYGSGKDIIKTKRKIMKGPTVAQFAKAILNQPKISTSIQNKLFP